jgi:hypothetical protein
MKAKNPTRCIVRVFYKTYTGKKLILKGVGTDKMFNGMHHCQTGLLAGMD